jgi:hypothetical protein
LAHTELFSGFRCVWSDLKTYKNNKACIIDDVQAFILHINYIIRENTESLIAMRRYYPPPTPLFIPFFGFQTLTNQLTDWIIDKAAESGRYFGGHSDSAIPPLIIHYLNLSYVA